MAACICDVRFTPKSGHWNSVARCPLCAKSRRWLLRLKILPSSPVDSLLLRSSVSGRGLQQKFGEAFRHIDHHVVAAGDFVTAP